MVTVSRPRRRNSLRLQGYDYSQAGSYFVTFCIEGRLCILGDIVDNRVVLSPLGQVVLESWYDLPRHYPHMMLGAMVIMPNHVHAIIGLDPLNSPNRATLSEIVRGWKAFTARTINEARGMVTARLWQRGFWDHIIQNDKERHWIETYIKENPLRWTVDQLHPSQTSPQNPDVWLHKSVGAGLE